MNKLFLNTGKGQVQIAELALITGKEQAVIGNDQRDLILRTAGNIQIQVANKFYTLDFKGDTTGSTVTSNVTVLAKDTDLTTLIYPGDGVFVFIMESSSFYITVAGGYVQINKSSSATPSSTLYLSYNSTQKLTGSQKQILTVNAGNISSFDSISNYTATDVYTSQIVYNIALGKFFKLKDATNPAAIGSWQEAFLSLDSGGIVKGGVTIDKSNIQTVVNDSALHINGIDKISIGSSNYSSGTTVETDLTNTIVTNLLPNTRSGYIFRSTADDSSTLIPLTIYGKAAALFGSINFAYNLTTYGTSLFTDVMSTTKGIQDPTYSTGPNGTGYGIYKDANDSKWVVECDRLVVRSDIADQSTFQSKSINGSYWSNPSINVTSFNITGTILTYGLANKLGNYKDVGGTKILRTLAEKPQYIQAAVPIDITDPTSVSTVQLIKLNYGYGDRSSTGTIVSDSCFFKEDPSGSYSVPTGQYDLVSGVFVPTSGGAYIVDQVISVVQILTPSYTSCVVGDLLFYQSWNPDTTDNQRAVVEVVSIDNNAGAIYVYAYNSSRIFQGQELVRVGNTLSSINNGIQFNGIDTQGDYIEQLTNVTTFRDLFSNFFLNEDGYELLTDIYQPGTSATTNKFGAINNLSDVDLDLTQTAQVGLYSSNAYMRGKFVANKLILNDIASTTTLDNVVIAQSTGRLTKMDISTLVSNWNTAYSWGNHALAGYALSSALASAVSTLNTSINSLDTKKSDFKQVATYADMLTDSTPGVMTIYKVLADEDKSLTNTVYQWWPDGKRVMLTTITDN